MTTITLTRYDIENLFIGLERVASCAIPQATRYAIARTVSSLRPEIDATNTAYPRPEPDAPTHKHVEWNQARHPHMLETVEVSIHPPREMPEIDFQDLVRLLPDKPLPVVHQFHQALVSSLIPWVDAREEVKMPELNQ
jgi:hypothetical protein